MKPTLSIVIVTMNHLNLLKNLLNSLFVTSSPKVDFEVIIVDNCSQDKTIPFLQEEYPQISIKLNKSIQGFAKNNNDGVAIAKGKYILILNPDIIVLDGSIDKLLEYLQQDPDVGIVAPQLLNPDLTLQYSARQFMTLKLLFFRLLTKGQDDSENKYVKKYLLSNQQLNTPIPVDWCMGAALLFKTEFYKQLKGFDEKFFLYVEDADICHRCWTAGKKVIYLPNAKMIHVHQRASTKKITKKTILHIKSYLYFFLKNRFHIQTHTKITSK